jgi:hypothetical protein
MTTVIPVIPVVSNKGKIIFFTILGAIVIIGGWLGWKELKKLADAKKAAAAAAALKTQPKYQQTALQAAATRSDTQSYTAKCPPFAQGCTGSEVSVLQNGLIDAYGASILPRYGSDSNWGAETQAALISKGWKTSYTSLNDITSEILSYAPNSNTVAVVTNVGIGTDVPAYTSPDSGNATIDTFGTLTADGADNSTPDDSSPDVIAALQNAGH